MAVKSVGIFANQPTSSALATADTERGPSPIIWGAPGSPNAWAEDFIQDPRLGYYFFDDFNDTGGALTLNNVGQYGRWATQAETTDPTITDDGIIGGGWKLAASTTAHRGVALSTTAGGVQFYDGTNLVPGQMAFECRVKISSIAASTLDMFVGLMDNLPVASTIPITATGGTLSTTPDLIGFHARGGSTNPGDFSVAYNVAAGTVQYPTGLTNLVNTVTGTALAAATYVKLGFVYNPKGGQGGQPYTKTITTAATSAQTVGNSAIPMLQFFVNGIPCATFLIKGDITAATFCGGSTAILGPVVAFKQQSTTASISASIDWIRVAQSYSA